MLRSLTLFVVVALLIAVTASTALANGAPPLTHKPIVAPRNNPSPIPHSSILDPNAINNYLQSGGLPPASVTANAAATAQGVAGQPGVLQTTTGVSSGLTLFRSATACNDFNARGQWRGELWTNYFAGWGAYAADDGFHQAKNVTFDREPVIGPGANYGGNQAALKIASNQPYEAGVMSPAIAVRRGDMIRVRVAYLIYNHGTPGRNTDYASMGIIPRLGETASYVIGVHRGEWAILEQEVQAAGNRVVVMLQGHSPDAINSNIYFDNVEIWVNGVARRNCRG
jgi:hypothetical protein